mmetsp:Transcript_284/g.1187  ORF Transcript_284/g.1187 Transcript_284/m.1187 type:complete len:206 (+) Transcript_284:1927-2544(+)
MAMFDIVNQSARRAFVATCVGGIHKTCLRKNVFKSNAKPHATRNAHFVNLAGESVGRHVYLSKLAGAKIENTRRNRPPPAAAEDDAAVAFFASTLGVAVNVFVLPLQSYIRPCKNLIVAIPAVMPNKLHIMTSHTHISHQHSLKFGCQCSNVSSHNSNATEYAHNNPQSRIAIALPYHPNTCASENTSKHVSYTFPKIPDRCPGT